MNPWFLAYSNLTGMLDVAKPGAIIVTGRGNRYDPQFQEARKRGAKVAVYCNVLSVPDNLNNPNDQEQFLIDGQRPPLWPYPTPGTRSNNPGTKMLDIRTGSIWLPHILAFVDDLCNRKLYDMFFFDTLGAQLWDADYKAWPMTEQIAWTTGCAQMARLLAERIAGRAEIVHNNLWTLSPKSHPAYEIGVTGEKFCNGICLENPPAGAGGVQPNPYHVAVAGRDYGLQPRRVLVIHKTDEWTVAWSKVPGVTHVASVEKLKGENYAQVTPPVVPYTGWSDAPPQSETDRLKLQVSELTAANEKLQQANSVLTRDLLQAQAQLEIANKRIDDLNRTLDQIHTLSAPGP